MEFWTAATAVALPEFWEEFFLEEELFTRQSREIGWWIRVKRRDVPGRTDPDP